MAARRRPQFLDEANGVLMPMGRRPHNIDLIQNDKFHQHRMMIGTPTTGLIRFEWHAAVCNQIIPCNWGVKKFTTWTNAAAPIGYQVADAQNIICKAFIDANCEWLFLHEHDNILPPDCFLRLDEWMRSKKYPVISGLYFTKSDPPDPLVYRGRGTGSHLDWKMGDRIKVDGIPTGCALIHGSLIKAMWAESETYMAGNVETRRVFSWPQATWYDPDSGWHGGSGTSDLEWCARVITQGFLAKAGWKKLAKEKYPFIIDTQIFTPHIDQDGTQFPIGGIPKRFLRGNKPHKPALARRR